MVRYQLWAERIEDGDGRWIPHVFDDLDLARAFAGKNAWGLLKGKYIIAVYTLGKKGHRVGEVFRANRKLIYRDLTSKNDQTYALGTNGKLKYPVFPVPFF